jgi:exodeoxyribonuclease V alpha subunit
VTRRNPARFGLDPRRDIQVLTPMRRGPAGAAALNTALQEAIPRPAPTCRNAASAAGSPGRGQGGPDPQQLRQGHQIRNNYDKGTNGVFHGTQVLVTAVDLDAAALTVRTEEDEDIDYDLTELDELTHAYAVTVHRAQGSEYPCVIPAVSRQAGCNARADPPPSSNTGDQIRAVCGTSPVRTR